MATPTEAQQLTTQTSHTQTRSVATSVSPAILALLRRLGATVLADTTNTPESNRTSYAHTRKTTKLRDRAPSHTAGTSPRTAPPPQHATPMQLGRVGPPQLGGGSQTSRRSKTKTTKPRNCKLRAQAKTRCVVSRTQRVPLELQTCSHSPNPDKVSQLARRCGLRIVLTISDPASRIPTSCWNIYSNLQAGARLAVYEPALRRLRIGTRQPRFVSWRDALLAVARAFNA